MIDEEEAGDEPVSAPVRHWSGSRNGGHLIDEVEWAHDGAPARVRCTCGVELTGVDDAEMAMAHLHHRQAELRAGHDEPMEKVKVLTGSNTRYELRLKGSPPPRQMTPADTMTSLEQRRGWDRAPVRVPDIHRLAGRRT